MKDQNQKTCCLPYRLIYRTQLSTTTGIGCPESCQMESNHQRSGRKAAGNYSSYKGVGNELDSNGNG